MSWPVLPHGFLGSRGTSAISDNDTYQIGKSLRFNSADTAYLSRTPSVAGNRKTWTFSAWVKRTKIGTASYYFLGNAQAPTGTNGVYFGFAGDQLLFGDYGASAWEWYVLSSSLYRDTAAWYHVVAQYDTTQATASERIKLYVNGVRLTAFDGASTYPTLNVDGRFNQASVEMAIGRLGTYPGNYFDGYMAEVNFVDGQALTPSSFGETDATTGRWKAKAFVGTYGTNGFYLPFSDNSSTPRSNLIRGSEDLGNTALWTLGDSSITPNTTAAPNGSLTADTFTDTATTNQHLIAQSIGTLTIGSLYTVSIYAKANTRTQIALTLHGENYAYFDLSNGTIISNGGYSNCGIQSVGNGWYRCYVTINKTNTIGNAYYLIFKDATNVYLGTGTGSIYIWGAQVELASSLGPYYPTTTSASTSTLLLGKDMSATNGGYNSWVSNNLSVTPGTGNDSLTDSPSNYGAISTTLVDDTYQISKSLRFNSADSAYLTRTPSVASNRTTWTWSGWVKRSALSSTSQFGLFEGKSATNNITSIFINTDALSVQDFTAGSYNLFWQSSNVIKDTSAWYHIVVAYDTTQSTAANAVKLYVNGAQQTLGFTAVTGAYTQNRNSYVNSTDPQYLGTYSSPVKYLDGYLAEVNLVDGQALTPDSFGSREANTYIWKPKAYTGTYGTNGFYLPFSDTTTSENRLLNSQGIGGTGWIYYGSVSLNSIVSPNGSTTATSYTSLTSDGTFLIGLAGLTSGSLYTASVWLKAPTPISNALLIVYSNPPFVNLGQTNVNVTTSWQRFSFSFTANASSMYFQIGGNVTIGNGVVLHAWGAQVNDGSVAKMYVPTTTAAVTNVLSLGRDFSTNAVSNWTSNNLSATEGTGNDSLVDSPTTNYGTLSTTLTDDTYQISRSLRFTTADLSYLTRTPSIAGNRKIWTWSGWVKRSAINTYQRIFNATSGNILSLLRFNSSNQIEYWDYNTTTSTPVNNVTTSQIIRDVSSWYHIVFSVDTTQVTVANRYRVFINGSQVNQFASQTTTQSYDTSFNAVTPHFIGDIAETLNAYLAEVNFVDGQSLTADNFGVRDTKTYAWKPKAYTGTYGTNGFYLNFSDNSNTTVTTLGKDQAGSNNWSPINFSVTEGTGNDSLVDSPTYYGTFSTTPSEDTYQISKSLRFRGASSGSLKRTPATSAGNPGRRTWNWSGWVKRSTLGTVQQLFNRNDALTPNVDYTYLYFRDDNTIQYLDSQPGSYAGTSYATNYLTSKAVFTDTSNWYHILMCVDTTQAIDTNRLKLYVNGVQITSFVSQSYPALSSLTQINTANTHCIGSNKASSQFFEGYLADINLVNLIAVGPESFGFKESGTNLWKPKAYTGAYGTLGFNLRFEDNSTIDALGKDSSPNLGDWTVTAGTGPNRFSITAGITNDSLVDSPTYYGTDNGAGGEARGSYCTLDPLNYASAGITLANGNLALTTAAVNVNYPCGSTMSVSSGKWYFEVTISTAGASFPFVGIIPATNYLGNAVNVGVASYTNSCWAGNGAFVSGDICGFAFDLNALTFTAYKNGVALTGSSVSSPTITSGLNWMVALSGVNGCVMHANFGQRVFAYAAPSGFKALRDYNKPPVQTGGELRGDYATLSPYVNQGSGGYTLSEGNLKIVAGTTSNAAGTYSTLGFNSGKLYAEFTYISASSVGATTGDIGVIANPSDFTINSGNTNLGNYARGFSYAFSTGIPYKCNNGTLTAYGSAWSINDVLGVALDLDAKTLTFYKNGISQGVAFSNLPSGYTWYFACAGSSWVFNANFGQRPWAFGAPFGFRPLRDYNKPDIQTGGELRGDYATLNPLTTSSATLSNGNLDYTITAIYGQCLADISVNSGKWYWELNVGSVGNLVGIAQAGQTFPIAWGTSRTWYSTTGNFWSNSTASSSPGITFTTGDVIGFALDMDGGTLKGYKNGVLAGTIATGLTGSWHPAFIGHDGSPGSKTGSFNFGQRQYVYPPPFGFKPLRDYNKLPVPTGGEVRGNYATLNLLFGTTNTIQDGNLVLTGTAAGNSQRIGTMAVASGKWYYEVTLTTLPASMDPLVGFTEINNASAVSQYPGQATSSYAIYHISSNTFLQKVNAGAFTNTNTTVAVQGDILGVALDLDNGRIWFSKNGTWVDGGNPSLGTNAQFTGLSGTFVPAVRGTGGATATTITCNFGQRPWAYDAPFGFKPLCTTLLPQPIVQKSSTAMDVVTYTGTASALTVSGLNFSPDLLWIKNRTLGTGGNHVVFDSVRGGPSNELYPNLVNSEAATTGALQSLNSNGFTLSNAGDLVRYNNNTNLYVAWAWDAGSTTSTNTSGSITSTVRANPQVGVSIVNYTGAGATGTIGHGLGIAPSMFIVKSRNVGGGWPVYHKSIGNTGAVQFESVGSTSTSILYWNNTNPTSSLFTVNAGMAANGTNYITYCFSEIEGYSRFGSYAGNGNVDGPFVYCGFRPRFVMVKRIDVGDAWIIKDTARSAYNGYDVEIYPSSAAAEGGPYSPPIMDYLSNGFKLRSNTSGSNATSGNYIFAAFAESPFKYSRAR